MYYTSRGVLFHDWLHVSVLVSCSFLCFLQRFCARVNALGSSFGQWDRAIFGGTCAIRAVVMVVRCVLVVVELNICAILIARAHNRCSHLLWLCYASPLYTDSHSSLHSDAMSFSACFVWCGFQTGNTVQVRVSHALTQPSLHNIHIPSTPISSH